MEVHKTIQGKTKGMSNTNPTTTGCSRSIDWLAVPSPLIAPVALPFNYMKMSCMEMVLDISICRHILKNYEKKVITAMVNNSNNINKTNNHHSLNTNRPHVKIHVLSWDRHKNVVELNRLMRSQPSPLDNWISQ